MLIAITGGIGSGKSVVSRIVAMMGYDVYDCDSRAKRLMDMSIMREKKNRNNRVSKTHIGNNVKVYSAEYLVQIKGDCQGKCLWGCF